MTITELQIVACWKHTDTFNGCRAFIETMSELQREAFNFGDLENVILISDACGLAITKSEILLNNPTVH